MAARLKKGDEVIVITGKDKGRRGTVIDFTKNDRVLVEGVNMVKKTVRPDPNKGVQGGIIDKEMPIHASNIMIFNPKTSKGDRVGFTGEGKDKTRVFKSSGEPVEV